MTSLKGVGDTRPVVTPLLDKALAIVVLGVEQVVYRGIHAEAMAQFKLGAQVGEGKTGRFLLAAAVAVAGGTRLFGEGQGQLGQWLDADPANQGLRGQLCDFVVRQIAGGGMDQAIYLRPISLISLIWPCRLRSMPR